MTTYSYIPISPEEFRTLIQESVKSELTSASQKLSVSKIDPLLTRHQAAQFLHVNLSTLWTWTKRNKIKAYGLGNRVYYKLSEIEKSLVEINRP